MYHYQGEMGLPGLPGLKGEKGNRGKRGRKVISITDACPLYFVYCIFLYLFELSMSSSLDCFVKIFSVVFIVVIVNVRSHDFYGLYFAVKNIGSTNPSFN